MIPVAQFSGFGSCEINRADTVKAPFGLIHRTQEAMGRARILQLHPTPKLGSSMMPNLVQQNVSPLPSRLTGPPAILAPPVLQRAQYGMPGRGQTTTPLPRFCPFEPGTAEAKREAGRDET
jgi:hypothetical protein